MLLAQTQGLRILQSEHPTRHARPAACTQPQQRCRRNLQTARLMHRADLPRPSSTTRNGFCSNCHHWPLRTLTDADTTGSSTAAQTQVYTCKRCKQRFSAEENRSASCRFHPALWSGGEVAKAIGFVRQSAAAEHQLGAVVGRRGLLRFWDCCGAGSESAPGCCSAYHITFDAKLNMQMGWESPLDQ